MRNQESVRTIANERGLTRAAVEAILDAQAEEALSARALRRLLHVEAARLEAIKQVLFEKAMAGENSAAAIFIKASERLSSMIGINAPQGHFVSISASIEPPERPSNTVLMLERIRELKAQSANEEPEDEEPKKVN